MRLEALRIPLDVITKSSMFRLLSVRPYYKYEGQKRTDEILGFKYMVGDAATFEQYDIKVPGVALIQPEQLDTITEPIDVRFANCIAKPYRRDNGSYELSFTADTVQAVR